MSALLRRDGETKSAHDAFLLYASMADRSLEAVAEETKIKLKTIERYAEQHDWAGRVEQLEKVAIANSEDKPNIEEWPIECQRREGESPKMHSYFVQYILMGSGRSLAKLGQKLGLHVTRMEQLSSQYEWQKRLQVHHDWEVQQTLRIEEHERSQRAKIVAADEWDFYNTAKQELKAVIENKQGIDRLNFESAIATWQRINTMARNSLRMDARTAEEDAFRLLADIGVADPNQVLIFLQAIEMMRRQQREYQRGEYKPTETSGENVINLYEMAATNGHNGNGHQEESES